MATKPRFDLSELDIRIKHRFLIRIRIMRDNTLKNRGVKIFLRNSWCVFGQVGNHLIHEKTWREALSKLEDTMRCVCPRCYASAPAPIRRRYDELAALRLRLASMPKAPTVGEIIPPGRRKPVAVTPYVLEPPPPKQKGHIPFSPDWDLTTIPSKLFFSEMGRRQTPNLKRIPKKMRRCKYGCGAWLTSGEALKHFRDCPLHDRVLLERNIAMREKGLARRLEKFSVREQRRRTNRKKREEEKRACGHPPLA